jgi:DNA polymerase I-like protein with 3'-5' exonuclease and polymerase domains
MDKIALIETKRSRTNFKDAFDNEFEFDQYQLCSDPTLKKVLKRDCDIDFDPDEYDWIILVGSDSLKYFTKINSITEYSGKLVDEKFLPIINPAMLSFKPEMRTTWDASKRNVIDFIKGNRVETLIDESVAIGIDTTKEAVQYIKDALQYECDYIGLDSETSALYPRNGSIIGISLCYDGKSGAYIDADCIDEECEFLLQRLFDQKKVIFHNAKFDLAFFEYHFNFKFPNFEDTMLLHYLIDENPGTHGLKSLALKYTVFGDYEKDMHEWITNYCKTHGVLKGNFTYDLIPFDIMKKYAAIDALVTFLLFEKFIKIKQNKKLAWVYDNLLIPGTRFLTDLQDNGVPFDIDRLVASQAVMESKIETAISHVYEHPAIYKFEEINGKPFNPNSVVQLRKLLFDYMGLKPTGKKTGTGANSTDAEVLQELSGQSEVPKLILAIRQKTKIKNTYLDKIIPQLDKDSRLRTNFNLHTTTSGRLSSSGKLNMQQLPRDEPAVKGSIVARPGYKIVAMDLTTAEVYIAAVLAKDIALQKVFRSGGDFHGTIAHQVFGLSCEPNEVKELFPLKRQAAKAVSFGIMYGAQAKNISEQVTKETGTYFSAQEAQEVIDDYFKKFRKLKEWLEESKKFIETNGFIYSAFGRKRRLPNVMSSDSGIKSHSIRSGLNFLVQSVASDVNLLAGIDMQAWLNSHNKDVKIFGLVHDSVLAEVPDDYIDTYSEKLQEFVQLDRGVSIKGCPIGCDFDVHQDYSLGKYAETYG